MEYIEDFETVSERDVYDIKRQAKKAEKHISITYGNRHIGNGLINSHDGYIRCTDCDAKLLSFDAAVYDAASDTAKKEVRRYFIGRMLEHSHDK
jgi:hypothetical protein